VLRPQIERLLPHVVLLFVELAYKHHSGLLLGVFVAAAPVVAVDTMSAPEH